MENVEIGNRIRETRQNLRMSMKELGRRVNLHESTISRYEKGEIQALDIEKLKDFAKALNVSSSYLIGWKDEENHSNLEINNEMPFVEIIGARISYIRQKRNMSVEELANKVGITPSQLQDMENGINRGFNSELMKKFCEVLNVQNSFFISMLEPVESIGDNVRSLRMINELTKKSVADELNITEDKLTRYENGIDNIPYDVLDKFANLFNVDVTMLLGMNFKARENEPHFKTTIRILERTKRWNEIVGESNFTDAEMEELMNYAKFILSKRGSQ